MNARHANGTAVLVNLNGYRSWGRIVARLENDTYRVFFAPGQGQAIGNHVITSDTIVGTESQPYWTLPTPGYKF